MIADKNQLQTAEIPSDLFAKVSEDLIADLSVSHIGNKNILVMVDHLTGWPTAKVIPERVASPALNAIYDKLILGHTCPQILCLAMTRNLQLTCQLMFF